METNLLPCPFCGGEAKAFYCEESGTFDVQCQVCGAIPYTGYRRSGMSPDEVIEAWNRRAYRPCCPKPCNEQCWCAGERPYYEADLRRAVSDMMDRRANDAD